MQMEPEMMQTMEMVDTAMPVQMMVGEETVDTMAPVMDAMPMAETMQDMPVAAESFLDSGWFTLAYVVIMIVTLVLGVRKNRRDVAGKIKIEHYVGFWHRISIKIIDTLLGYLIIPVFLNIFYYLRDGQTIGDKIYGTRIVDAEKHKVATSKQLLNRWVAKLVSFLTLGFGFWMAGWRDEKKALHDGMAGVRYVSEKNVNGFLIALPIILVMLVPLVIMAVGAFHGYMDAAEAAM